MRLQVTDSPYSYNLIEKSSSEVLVSQDLSYFIVGSTVYTVASLENVVTTSTSLTADMTLNSGTHTGHIVFSFNDPNILTTTLKLNTTNATQIGEEFNDQGEHYYGIWEYPFNGSLDNRGVDKEFLGFFNQTGSNFTSGRAPFYVTSKKYGIYAQSQSNGRFTIAVNGKTKFYFSTPELTYHTIYGPTYESVLTRYNQIAGGSFMPPTWAFDSIWWKDDDHLDLHNASNAQENVLDTANQLRNHQIPASAYWIDRPYGTGTSGWGNMDFGSSFPNPSQMVQDLEDRGMRLMLWIANRAWNNLYTEGSANGYLFPGISPSVGPATDMRIPEAYSWFKQNLSSFVNLGVKGYKIDRGEETEMPNAVQNENITLFAKMAAEGLADRFGSDHFIFARNVNDTGRRYTAVWNGDSIADFTGLRYSVLAGIRSGTINFPIWGSDTGGYMGNPTKEVFVRWLEFSAYSPMMEILIGGGRTPWYNYDQQLINITREQVTTHHDLIPYTRSFAHTATQIGLPIMRMLQFSFPNDSNLFSIMDQYMYGSELLIAPVLTAGATSRSVYLPQGNWVDYRDKTSIQTGPTTITAGSPIDSIPVFAKEGAIIPRGDILRSNNNWTTNWSPSLRIEFFPSESVSNVFNYYTGTATKMINSRYLNNNFEINIEPLDFDGTAEIYVKGFSTVQKNGVLLTAGVDYTFDPIKQLLTIPFSGQTSIIIADGVSIFSTSPTPTPTVTPTPSPTVTPTPSSTPSPTPTPTSTPTPVVRTITLQVNASTDDAHQSESGNYLTSTTLFVGGDTRHYTGMRFTDVTIPQGATINNAYVEVYTTSQQWISTQYDIYAEAADNSQTFSTSAWPNSRLATNAKSSHNSNVKWLASTWNQLQPLTSSVAEVISRPGWSSGNALSIILHGTGGVYGRKSVQSYNGNPLYAAKLTIEYQDSDPNPSSTPTPTQTALPTPSPTLSPTPTPTPTPVPTPTPTPSPTPSATPTPGPLTISNLSVFDSQNAVDWSIRSNIQVGNTQYGDRSYTFASIPSSLLGSGWIRSANDSKYIVTNPLVTFSINQPARVYVAVDNRVGRLSWMDSQWITSTDTLRNNESTPSVFTLYYKDYPAGNVSLGSSTGTVTQSMYTVVVK